MLCLDNFATGHLGISSSHHVHFALAVFDLELRLGYLCNLKAVALNDFYFSVHSHKFKTEVSPFLVLSCVVHTTQNYIYTLWCSSWSLRVLEDFSQEIFLSATSHDFSWQTTKKACPWCATTREQYMAERRQKGVLIYVLLLKGLEGIWRVCFFSTPSFFWKLASQEGELWAFISEWKACGWHPEQRGLSARPRQTSVPGLYSKNPGAGRGAVVGRGWERVAGKRKRGGVRGLGFFFFSWGRYLRGFESSGGRGVMDNLIYLIHCIVGGGRSWPLISPFNHTALFRLFFFVSCHLSRTNIHPSVNVNIITWLAPTLIQVWDACFSYSFMLECVSPVSQRSSPSLTLCLWVCEWMYEWEAKSGLCGQCLMEKDIRNTAGRLNVYFSEDIYTVWSTLKQFAYFNPNSPVTCTHGLSLAIRGNQRVITHWFTIL